MGFIFGSAAAITFALIGTTVVFFVLRSEYPRLESELVPLLTSGGLFSVLTVAAGSSFYGEIKERRWRRRAWLGLLLALVLVAAYHAWPQV